VNVTGGGGAGLCGRATTEVASIERKQAGKTDDRKERGTRILHGDILAAFLKSDLLRRPW